MPGTLPCGVQIPACADCELNQGFDSWGGNQPCGQQNCWYGCTVRRYNGQQTCDEE